MDLTRRPRPSIAILLALTLLVAGCSHVSKLWPWRAKAPVGPEVSTELLVTSGEGGSAAAFPQYWKRNAVVVDLQGASGSGSVVLKPREATKWPVRIAFRVVPGSVGVLDVAAAHRIVLPIASEGTQPVDLELPPGSYSAATEQITVRWGPNATPAS